MQITPAYFEMKSIRTASLSKLLLWSLVIHLLVLITFRNENTTAPLITGKELAGEAYEKETLSVSILPNTLPVNTKAKHIKTKISPEIRHRENDFQNILASKSDVQQVKIIKPWSIKDKEPLSSFQQTKVDKSYTNLPLARKNAPHKHSTETVKLLQASLGKQLSEYFYYPRLARKRGWQGQVKLRLRIEGNGNLSNIRLYKSSGYPSLDNAALSSLQKVAYLPDARTWLHGMHYDIVVPVEYHLIDS